MVRNLAKKAMTTTSQRFCFVIDHLVEALGNHSSSSLRRALILTDIDQYPETSQTGIMERLGVHKSAVNREIEWLFNYGCIVRQECTEDARTVKLQTCGYSKKALDAALDYVDGDHEILKEFLRKFSKLLKQEKPTLRDARIVATIHERGGAEKNEVVGLLYGGASATTNRAVNKLIDSGVIEDA